MKVNSWFVGFMAMSSASLFAAEIVPVNYHSDVAPLLRQYCAGCHNDVDFEGDFSVERYIDLEEGGSKGVMLRPGDPEDSQLIKLLTGGTKEAMPPEDEPQPTTDEIALLKRWIKEGAHGPDEAQDVSILSMLEVPDWAPAAGQKAVTAMAASADGKVRAEARFGQVSFSVANDAGAASPGVLQLEKLSGKINALHFSPNNPQQLVTASGVTGLNGVATLWDLRDGKVIREFGAGYHRDLLYDAEFSPDGKILATAGYDTKIGLWDVASGELLRSIEVHTGAIFDLAFSPDGTLLASASADETAKVWRVSDGERLDTLHQPEGEQFAVTFSPDGRFIIAAGADNVIRMWRVVSTEKPRINPLIHARFAHEAAVVALVVSEDGKWLASSSDDHTIKLWALPRLEEVQAWENQPDVVSVLQLTGPQEFVAARMDGSGQFFRFDPKLLVAKAKPKAGAVVADTAHAVSTDMQEVMADEKVDVQPVKVPAKISGVIGAPGDTDDFRFSAKAGQAWILEVAAASAKPEASMLDSKIEVLTGDGELIERVRLQAVRESWFTFRGKNSEQVNDFRIHNYMDMELNEFLYCNGEVVKLWLDPRGADSGFTVYPGLGKRKNYFGSSGLAHALGEPCYVVEPIADGVEPAQNGLPIYTVYYENDDDPDRVLGSDSKLDFVAPADGDYIARISDVRGFGGADFSYALTLRQPEPDFKITYDGTKGMTIPAGSGKEFIVDSSRIDDFEGEIRIDVEGLPPGFKATTPLVIEQNQVRAMGVVYANADAAATTGANMATSKLVATAMIDGKKVRREVGTLGPIKLDPKPARFKVEIFADGEVGSPKIVDGKLTELTIHPGETITAIVRSERGEFKDRIQFGNEDSGRNLAHGLRIDNIGLSGLMIPEDQTERKFFISAKDWVADSTRWFFLRGTGIPTPPIKVNVVRLTDDAGKVAVSGED